MKTYRVLASYTTYCYLNIEAENEDDARELGYDADGGDFSTSEMGDWTVDDVIELEET